VISLCCSYRPTCFLVIIAVLTEFAMTTGFAETTLGCCGTGLTEVGILCNRFTPICRNVSSYVFYDAVHPTERVYRIATDYIVKNVIPQF
uniref:GDSL esterase/lipase n=1 Tax=Aegilops tauschii subsp. strangulata TaxID=200361 RepID=A0A453FUK8_AEGTS